jgi:cell division protein FtsQ
MAKEDDIPNECDAEEESPYRRRTREVVVRRGRVPRRLGRILKWISLTALVAAPLVYGGYQLAAYALTSPRFSVHSAEDVVLEGNRYVTHDDILNALGMTSEGRGGANILRMSLEEARQQVESLPWVRSATVARSYPHRLRVRITERVPIAFLTVGGRVKLVDEEGEVLDKPDGASFAFPVLEGLERTSNPAEEHARLALYQKFMREVGDDAYASGWLISEVNLGDADDIQAVLVQGLETIQVHFGHEDFPERLGNFLRLLPEVQKTHAIVDSVDLRYRGQIVVNPENPAKGGTAGRSHPAPAGPPPSGSQAKGKI